MMQGNPGTRTNDNKAEKRAWMTMRKKRIACAFVILALAALLCAFSGAEAGEKAPARMTIMVYLCGSDLESSSAAATQDLEEMRASGAGGTDVPLIVMAGGARKWANGYRPNELTITEINRGKSRVIERGDARSMGDPETLRYLIDYTEQHFPAQEYALIFWDHGNGPMEGFCLDELYRPERLSVEEVAAVLGESGFSEKKLKWIGFDTCLMGSAEVAMQLAPYAEYMIASEESEPGFGWDYSFLKGIENDASTLETARRIIDLYTAQDTQEALTLSCLDLSRIEVLIQAVDGIFSRAASIVDPTDYSALSRLRKTILSYGADVSRGMLDHDLVDLGQLVNNLSNLEENELVFFRQAMEQAVVYRKSNLPAASGISVYFPYYNKSMYDEWIARYPMNRVGSGYAEYIQEFGGMLTACPFADWSGLDMRIYLADQKKSIPSGAALEAYTALARTADPGYIERLTPEEAEVQSGILARTELSTDQQRDFLSARLLVLERFHTLFSAESRYRVVWSSSDLEMDENGAVRGIYPEQTLHVVNTQGASLASEISCHYRENGDLAVQAIAKESYSGNTGYLRLMMIFRPDGNGNLIPRETYVFDELTGNYTNRIRYAKEEYPYLVFPYQYMIPKADENGERLDAVQWEDSAEYNRETVIPNDDSWHLEFRDASGQYALAMCMEITDTQNNRHISTIRTVDWGYGSRDLILDHPNLRVIAENVHTDRTRADLSLTFVSSELAEMDLAVYGASANGVPTGVLLPSGKEAPCSETIHLSAGEAFTRTVSFATNTAEPLTALDFGIALYYDEESELDPRRLENGSGYASLVPWESGASDRPEGPQWYCTETVHIQIPLREEPGVFSTDELNVTGAYLRYEDPNHWADLNSASPLAAGLSGKNHYYSIRIDGSQLMDQAEGLSLLIGTVRQEGNEFVMDVRQRCEAEPGAEGAVAFLISEGGFLLQSGQSALPITLLTGDHKASLGDLRLSDGGDPAQAHLVQAEVGEHMLRGVRWTMGTMPAELLREVRWETLQARWRTDRTVKITSVPRVLDMARYPLVIQVNTESTAEETALLTSRDGTILAVYTLPELLREEAAPVQEGFTEVLQLDETTGTATAYRQTEEWIWKEDGQSAEIIRYIGTGPTAVLPEQLGGKGIGSLASRAFTESQAFNVTFPSYEVPVNPSAFTGGMGRKKTAPDRGSLVLPFLQELSVPDRLEIHQRLGFARCVTDGEASLWAPPLVYRMAEGNGAEVIGCSATEGNVEIPEHVEGLPVTAIGEQAFSGTSPQSRLRGIIIPEGVTRIGAYAFQGREIREITLPASLREIGAGILNGCRQLQRVRIRCSLDLIGKDCFEGCLLLQRRPGGITLPDNAADEEIAAFMARVFPQLETPLLRESEQEDSQP